MKKQYIIAIAAATLSASAIAGTFAFERKSLNDPDALKRHREINFNLRPAELNYNATSSNNPENIFSIKSTVGNTHTVISNLPESADWSYTNIATEGCYWQNYSILPMGETNEVNVIANGQSYGSKNKQNNWLWIPITLEYSKAKLTFSGRASIDFDPQNFEIVLCQNADTLSQIATIAKYDKFLTSPSSKTNFKEIGGVVEEGPDAGDYYLALHVLPTNGYGQTSFTGLTLVEEDTGNSAVPELGPNGEIFELHPTEAQFNQSKVVDANNDGNTISYHVVTSEIDGTVFDWPIFYDASKSTNDADDWLITPKVRIYDASLKHTISIEAMALASFKTEAFEIAIGNSPNVESMTKIIMDESAVGNNNGEFHKYTANFAVAEAGSYYFGIRIKSPKSNSWRMAMRNFVVCQTERSALIPDKATDIKITADNKGALKANVEFKLPTMYLNGQEMPTNDEVSVDVISAVETKSVSGKAGEAVSVEIATIEGLNSIQFVSHNANGEGNSTRSYAVCGIDIPQNPKLSYHASDDNMSLTLNWETSTVGVNGGIVDLSELSYTLYILSQSDNGYVWTPIIQNITETSIVVNAPNETQTVYDLMVSATNIKGESNGGVESSISVVLGKPYALPITDNFEGKTILNGLTLAYPTDDYAASWALDNPGLLGDEFADENGCALICISQTSGENKGQVILPKFTTLGTPHPRVKLRAYCYSGMAQCKITAYSTNMQPIELGTINSSCGNGWCDIIYDLPESLANKPWVYLVADIAMADPLQYFILDQYDVYARLENDFAVLSGRLTGDERQLIGETIPFEFVIENHGYGTLPVPELEAYVTVDGNMVQKVELSTPEHSTLADGETTTVNGYTVINKSEYAGKSMAICAHIITSDGDKTNNYFEIPFALSVPSAPIVTDLSAEQESDSSVLLSWTNPYAEGYLETFENSVHGVHISFIGDWKNIDFDGRIPYVLGEYPVPDAGQPRAFQVLDVKKLGMDDFPTPSGNKILCAMSANGAQSDDWFISPEIEGGSILSFQLTTLAPGFLEEIELLYSTTDNDVDSFEVAETIIENEAGWNEYRWQIPEDARYVAIHYASTDMFGILIDDLCYNAVEKRINVTGYNIYRNDEKIATCTDTTWSDTTAEAGNNYYNVTVLGTENGVEKEYPLSNTAILQVSGINEIGDNTKAINSANGHINAIGYEGDQISVHTIEGIQIAKIASANAHESIEVTGGIYLVTAGNTTVKVVVK